jgi:prepilin-type N-terminal cleavage/methylation domain-containing protein/prepilin-type processing-associated H-X9-DG protein
MAQRLEAPLRTDGRGVPPSLAPAAQPRFAAPNASWSLPRYSCVAAPGTSALRGGPRPANAFTLIELLVVIAIVALLAALMFPGLSRARAQAQAIQCAGNLKQLQLAWVLYAQDNDDKLVPECVNSPSPASVNLYWAQGFLSFDGSNPDNTNTTLLLDPRFALLGSYTRAAGIYKCPADKSQVPLPDRWAPRVRSVVMNLYAGGVTLCSSGPLIYWGTQKMQQFVSPPASSSFVFLDEHPDSIGPTYFRLLPDRGPDATFWYDFPGSYHDGRGSLSFADGHVELHRWLDARTKPPIRYTGYLPVSVSSPDNPDIAWLQDHTSLSTVGDVSIGPP